MLFSSPKRKRKKKERKLIICFRNCFVGLISLPGLANHPLNIQALDTKMAELFISPVLQVVLDKLSTPGVQMMGNILGVGVADNIKKLRKTLDMVQFVIEDAEEQLASDAAARIWLSSLKDFAYDALYLLLDFETRDSQSFCMKNAEKIRFVLSELERVVDKLLLEMNTGAYRLPVYKSWAGRETSYPVKESEVHGREQDKENIVNLLVLSDSFEVAANHSIQDGEDVPCVIIEGMTAIGKTTLAPLAFNDQKITQHFDIKVWVFVSHHFDPKKILTAVVESVTNDSCCLSNLSALHSAVERSLKDRRYFIVLDDVWTDKKDDWDRLRPLFGGTSAKYGSRILITTQNKKLAVAMKVSPYLRYSLRGLSEDHCWGLFKQLAFEPGEEDKYPILRLIGQEIVRKCGGVALAAKSLGSLLRFKRNRSEWSYIRDHELWNLDEEAESGILPALRLSYSRLPRHLKRCFVFCSIFPQGYSINKEKLIHLWMAQGLIVHNYKDRTR